VYAARPAQYRANPTTGKLSLVGKVAASQINAVSISGDRIDVLVQLGQPAQTNLEAFTINHATGALVGGTPFALTAVNDSSVPVTSDEIVATGAATGAASVATVIPFYASDHFAGQAVAVYPSTGRAVSDGDAAQVPPLSDWRTMQFLQSVLVVGEAGDQDEGAAPGPQLGLFAPDGDASDGIIDLTQPPYNLPGSGDAQPNDVAAIFSLGKGVYIGSDLGPIVQGTDGVGGNGLVLNQQDPTVTGSASATVMTGYLVPPATTTTVTVGKAGRTLHLTGSVKGGIAGLPVAVTVYRRTGNHFHPIATKSPTLSPTKRYKTTVKVAKGGTCRVTARYAGDAESGRSQVTKHFTC
jgi:hypothetical protein